MSTFQPFADDSASVGIGGLTVENGTERLAIYGSLDITRDKQGLADARTLLDLVTRAVAVMEAHGGDLPAKANAPAAPKSVRNPFAPE